MYSAVGTNHKILHILLMQKKNYSNMVNAILIINVTGNKIAYDFVMECFFSK